MTPKAEKPITYNGHIIFIGQGYVQLYQLKFAKLSDAIQYIINGCKSN